MGGRFGDSKITEKAGYDKADLYFPLAIGLPFKEPRSAFALVFLDRRRRIITHGAHYSHG